MIDFLIIAIVALIVGLAGFYVYRAKKAGKTCIGCPDSGKCSGNCSGCPDSGKCSGNCSGCSGNCGCKNS